MDRFHSAASSLPTADELDPLRVETGWNDVRTGLHRILIGHIALVALPVLGAILLGLAIARGGSLIRFVTSDTSSKINYETELLFIGSLVAFLATFLVSYPLILTGQWRCLMYAPERCNARWLMFVCMITVVAGPSLAILSGLFGTGRSNEEVIKMMNAAIAEANPWKSPTIVYDLASTGLSLASVISFALFLRSVASCFNHGVLAGAVDLYIVVLIGLTALGLLALLGSGIPIPIRGLMLLGWVLGMIVSFVWYLVLVVWASSCIAAGLASVRSPLQMAPPPRWS